MVDGLWIKNGVAVAKFVLSHCLYWGINENELMKNDLWAKTLTQGLPDDECYYFTARFGILSYLLKS